MKINKFGVIILATCLILCTLALSGCSIFNPTQATETTSKTYKTPTTTTPFATSTPLPPMTSDSLELTYEDNFSNPDSGWLVSFKDDVSYSYVDGEYNISVYDSGMLHSYSNKAVGVQVNFVVEVDTRVLSSVDTSKYGVLFRRNDNGEFYGFMIAGNQYSVRKYVQSEWYYLQSYTESKYILTDGSKNNLKIACLGTTMEVYINGQRLVTLDDDSLASGKISLMASEMNTSVNFDNFKLYKFTNAYIAKAAPEIPVIITSSLPDGEVGVSYKEALTASGGTAPYFWELTRGDLPEGLSLDGYAGTITGIPTMEGKYDFTIKLTSKTGEATEEMSIYISELIISTESLANGIINVYYNQVLEASGGKPPYTWSITSGSLPDGLVLDAASGAITGMPTRLGGPVTPIFKVADSVGASATGGLSLTIKLGDFQAIDQYADDTPASVETSLQTLVNYLVIPCSTDTEKARVIYRWIAQNIDFDVYTLLHKEAPRPNQGAEAVFARRDAVCEGYANLFLKMAGYAGLQAAYISGWGRTDYTDVGYTKDHGWNAVQINGEWQLLDVTWGAGYTDDNEQFVRSFNDFWFLTPPDQFVYSHCPDDSSWQLLAPPVPVAEIAQYPVVKSYYFTYGLSFGNYNYGFCSVANGEGTICIQAPPDVLVMANLYQNDTKLERTLVFWQRQGDSYQINVRLPYAGDYELRIYAKWKTESGEYHMALKYKLTSNQNITNLADFPTIYNTFTESGAYLYSPMVRYLQVGTSQYFKIMVPGAKEVAVIMNAGTSSESWQYLSKQGQLFQGTFNIGEGTIRISARFTSDHQFSWLIEYNN